MNSPSGCSCAWFRSAGFFAGLCAELRAGLCAVFFTVSFAICVVSQSAAIAADDSAMETGIKEYTAGKYQDALDHLGAALNSEFNNAKLHYYMGNCHLKLRQKEAAVREFRIAYALEPTGMPGKYAKQALDNLDVDKGSSGSAGGSGGSSDIFTKGLQDQRALSKAIADYEKHRDGTNIFTPLSPSGSNGYPFLPQSPPNPPNQQGYR